MVAILNGLGRVKYEELFLLYGKIDGLLTAAGLTVVEPECGELVTSLDMSGLSLTLLWLDDELEHYWSLPPRRVLHGLQPHGGYRRQQRLNRRLGGRRIRGRHNRRSR